MTQIDFYVLPENPSASADQIACRIIEKAYSLQHSVYVHTKDQQQAKSMDDLLWTFRQGSFIPHEILNQNQPAQAPVIIGYQDKPDFDATVLVNLDHQVPGFFTQFERVAEIVDAVEPARSQARKRFRFYRDRGYPLKSHELS